MKNKNKESNLTRRKSVRFSDGLLPGQSLSFNEEHKNQNEIFNASTISFDEAKAINQIDSETHNGCILYKLSGNLRVHVSLIKISPYGKCWLYVTHGLCVNAQDELVFLLKNPSSELNEIPKQIIYHIMDIYEKSSKGHRISYMNHLLYNFDSEKLYRDLLSPNPKNRVDSTDNSLLGNKNNSGFLYFRPTKHHLDSILKNYRNYLPDQPYLIGYLIQKWEIPWVKLFPLRLFLRLGEQFNVYPCPVISDSNRKAVYGEIGHTIMSLLCDTRNFQYTIPQIDGVSIMTDEISTCISIPESQYDFVIKSLLTSNEYVFSFASLQFSDRFDSYLVAIENENLDSYSSKKVTCCDVGKTGVGFVVFNGAFKTTMTQNAKKTVIEDGVMIQIDIETLNKLKQALQSMNSFRIDCSKVKPDHTVIVEWIKEDDYLNRNILSVVDGKSMEGIKSLRLANTMDYAYEDKILKWIEIYILKLDEEALADDSNFNLNKFTEMISTATCMALNPLIDDLIHIQNENLKEGNSETLNFFKPFRIGLRIEINKDQVGYMLGMCKKQISESKILESLDNHLIQILHQINSNSVNLMLELVFYIQEKNKA
ncbi:unnamed protein product [Brachionus calyciflorus]|uniref:Smad anchor for receptor activation-like C-terminal domain-containing protein n=1 Tax=Brachionus calyciflorus TaxID=104777 RepID=A0A813Y6T4_9BILA|nr:unnamed protein product [Brachionus calyciflorus]